MQTAGLGSGLATAVDAATGDPRWATPLGIEPVSAGTSVTAGPVVHDGRLVVGTADGRLVAFGLPG